MARHEDSEPQDVVDRLLWRDAQVMRSRHAEQDPHGRCQWCHAQWPCPPRRLAERAEKLARQPAPPALETLPQPPGLVSDRLAPPELAPPERAPSEFALSGSAPPVAEYRDDATVHG